MGAENYTDDGSSLLELAVFTENYKLRAGLSFGALNFASNMPRILAAIPTLSL